MKKSKKPSGRAFTLAEIMIVLTVIGVLSAILLPVASNSMPDKNVIKFKKAHNTLATTIRSMISNDQYFTPGDFGRMPDGTLIASSETSCDDGSGDYDWDEGPSPSSCGIGDNYYFYEALADNLVHKRLSKGGEFHLEEPVHRNSTSTEAMFKAHLDKDCADFPTIDTNAPAMIFLSDDVVIYQYIKTLLFGDSCGTGASIPCYRDPLDPTADFYSKSSSPTGFDTAVYPICIDIDGSGPIKGFGYGLRRDGKIVNGLRADWWLERDITKKETDCCPTSLKNALDNNGSAINLCDNSDTVCGS